MNPNFLLLTLTLKRVRMNNPALQILFALVLLLAASPVYAQQGTISISGKVTDKDDKQPVHGASINIDHKGVGTATNVSGLFALIIPANNIADTLKISCIGYKTRQLPIATLKNGADMSIVLEKNTTELKEVVVGFHDPLKIIQKGISRIADNYISHPHILRGFYRMYTFSDQSPLQLSEAVFDVYNFGYGDKKADLFRLVKARNERNERDFADLELGQKPNSVFEADIINHLRASGFLSDEGIKKHKFEYKGTVDFQGYEAYRIDFKENPGAEDATFRGRMYVDAKTYAFIYFDFRMSPTGLSDLSSGNFVTRTIMRAGKVNFDLKRDHSTVSYQQVGNNWVLSNVSVDDVLAIQNPEAKDTLTANIKFNYQVTAVDTVAQASFSTKIARGANINDHASNASPEFWKDYNVLLSDYDTEDIFKQIQIINSMLKLKDK